MATGNGNQQQNNNQLEESRKIAGTGESYIGMVVKLGDFEYTTVGGGIEGDRQQLEPLNTTLNTLPPINNNINQGGQAGNQNNNSNPVTSTFNSTVVYYRAVSGNGVPIGTMMHQHQDGTIMVGNHNDPNYDMNNPDNVVTTTNPNPPIGSGNGGNGRGGNGNTNQGGGGMGGY